MKERLEGPEDEGKRLFGLAADRRDSADLRSISLGRQVI